MAGLNDFNITSKTLCVACLVQGNHVEMQPLEDVSPGQKRKCPTCNGTVGVQCVEWERKSE